VGGPGRLIAVLSRRTGEIVATGRVERVDGPLSLPLAAGSRRGAQTKPVRYYKRSVRQVSGLPLVCVDGAGREHCAIGPVWVA